MQMHDYVKERMIGLADTRAKHNDLQGMRTEKKRVRESSSASLP